MPPTIPETVTVHLGAPDDTSAQNIRVSFTDYIKNVASSEVFPDWPENALRANIYAQISFVLNRIYTEWYRSRGYEFDITNTTQFDQRYTPNGEVFENISVIVDEIFNNYIVRQGNVEPLFAQFCNGTTSTCEGLSQWGTVSLAEQGYTPYGILQYYYGDNIGIVTDAPTFTRLPSYPGIPLRLGDSGEDVRTIQRQLNRIAQNYPAITTGLAEDGFFGMQTFAAVRKFQEVFNLTQNGVVDKATWYKIKGIFNGVKGLSDLRSEGLTLEDISRVYERALGPGDTGDQVRVVQYYLRVISFFDENIAMVNITGVYDAPTEAAVRQFQLENGIAVDGIIGRDTWNAMTTRYNEILSSIPPEYLVYESVIFPGRFLSAGISGDDVLRLQQFINRAAANVSGIPTVPEDGYYGDSTIAAVRLIQEWYALPVNGVVGPLTWNSIVGLAQ